MARLSTKVLPSLAVLAACATASPVRGAEPRERPCSPREASCARDDERPGEGSGYQLSLGAAYVLPTASAVILWSARSWTSVEGTLAAASPMVLAAPAVHLSYGRAGSAGDSFLGQLGGGAVGALLGWGVGSLSCGDENCSLAASRGLVLGALAGQMTYGVLDVFGTDHFLSGAGEMITPFVSPRVGQSASAGGSLWGLDVLGFEFGVEARL